jgi:hypothetical protein
VRGKLKLPSPALVISLIALFVALGGTGYAAVKLNGKNIKSKSISGTKLKNRTITAGKVKKDGLDGSVIAESKLGKVPSAGTADSATTATTATSAGTASFASSAGNANSTAGLSLRRFSYDTTGGSDVELASLGGLRLSVTCTGATLDKVTATNVSGVLGKLTAASIKYNAANTIDNTQFDLDFNASEAHDVIKGDATTPDGSGQLTHVEFVNDNGSVASANLTGTSGTGGNCAVSGTIVGG